MRHVPLLIACLLAALYSDAARAQPAEVDVEVPGAEVLDQIAADRIQQREQEQEAQLERARAISSFELSEMEIACDLPQCEDETFIDALRDIIALEEGHTVSGDRLSRSIQRLARSLFFKEIRFDIDNGVLRWNLAGATTIRRVRVRAGLALSSRIERRISFRSGGVWSGDPTVIELQKRAIEEYFEREGYYGAEVVIEVEQVSEFVVDLLIRIDRGTRPSIRRVYIRGNDWFSYEEIFEVLVGRFTFLRGYTSSAFSDAADAVIARYREEGFLEARIVETEEDVDVEQGVVDLYLAIDEGPRWDLIVNGNRSFNDDRIIDASQLAEAGFIDRTELDAAERRIEELYETRGYFFARATIEERRITETTRTLSISINEGNVAEIREIRFVGNDALTELELRSLMTTSEYDLVTRGGYLQRARLDNELEKILDAYREAGFPWAQIERTVFLAENDGRELYVAIFIYEGPQLNVANVAMLDPENPSSGDSVSGDHIATEEEREQLREELSLQSGSVFLQESLDDDREAIDDFWTGKGFGSVTVSSSCFSNGEEIEDCVVDAPVSSCIQSLEEDRDVACNRTNVGDRTVEECLLATDSAVCSPPNASPVVEIQHEVAIGERTRFGHILVRGAYRTRDWVIVSEIPLLGECEPERRRITRRNSGFEPPASCPYDRDLLLQGQSNIRALGLFDSVRMEVIGPDEDTNVATIVISVEETTTQFIEYRIGLDSRPTGSSGNQFRNTNELSFRDINFLGRGEELRLVGGFDVALNEDRQVRDGEFDAEVRAIYFDPRFYLFGALRKPWEGRLELAYEYELLPVPPAPQTKTISLEGALRDSLRKFRGIFFEVGISIRRTLTRDQSDGTTTEGFEPSFILSILPRVTVERRDNPLNPTRGYFGEIAMEIADDFLGFLNSERFTTFTTRHSLYFPLGPFVLALNAQAGVGFGGVLNGFRRQGDLSLPLSERFFLGGVNSIRGVRQNSVDAAGTDEPGGDVFVNGNIELRYPLIPSFDIYGAAFFDVGQLAADVGDFRGSATVLTGGLGIRWLIAEIVPLVLDYGIILNRDIGEDFGRLHFNVGYTF